jgi:hypothetical protein
VRFHDAYQHTFSRLPRSPRGHSSQGNGRVLHEPRNARAGEYEAHNIGVKWPHHVFVNQKFEVVGAE